MIDKSKLSSFRLFLSKEHFNWDLGYPDEGGLPQFIAANAYGQYQFYSLLLKKVWTLNEELKKPQPDYTNIIAIAQEIKDSTANVPSIMSGAEIKLNVGWSLGSNLTVDFFTGLMGIFRAPIMGIVSVLCSIPYILSYSEYCGGPQFYLDTLVYFCESASKMLASIIFPINMLYSKYTTDSYNTLTKGCVERGLDGIISLAEGQLAIHNKHDHNDSEINVVPVF